MVCPTEVGILLSDTETIASCTGLSVEEVEAEAFELGGGVAVHKDEVEVVAQVALDGLDGSVISEGAHQHGRVVPLLDEVGDIQVVRLADRRKYLFGQTMPCSFLQK